MEPDNSIKNNVNVPANSKAVMTKPCSDCSTEQSVFMFPEIISLCHTSNEQTGNPNTEIVNDRNIIQNTINTIKIPPSLLRLQVKKI